MVDRQYRKLFAAGIINGIGDRFCQIALLALIYRLTGSGFSVGIMLGLRMIPFLVLSPAAGVLITRISRQVLMMTTDLFRGLAALVFLSIHSPEDIWIIYGVSTLLACGEALYAPARKSSIPLLVHPSELLKVNSLEQVMSGLVLVVGAAAGGIISALFGPQAAFILNAASFFAAAMIDRNIAFPPVMKEKISREDSYVKTHQTPSLLDSNRSRSRMLDCILSSVPLQVVIAFELLVPMLNGIDNVLISVYAVQEFRLGDAGIGLFYAALGAGLVASYAIGHLFSGSLLKGGLVCLLLEGILLMGLSGIYHAWAAVAIYFLISLAGGVGAICLDTLLMRETPLYLQGPLLGMLTAWSQGIIGLSMFGAGVAIEMMEPRMLGLAGGAGFIVISIVILMYYARTRSRKAA
ncbi:MFS transporter [Paenibacillus polymyxa]|uniref:MFS transporter n=1 Tax=Paenibacillus polymyxa TaxID=1406 RepID=A0A8I1LWI9_PAEPO|nr:MULTISPECIES: MFS transporter [Paenibacillus]KAF6567384.1 MFS transporter [Paenibacillus sp. EKM206P]KAF6588135.1 MFS transporter [Paenibacillus sp. EKM205P]MBM0636098.1 MFS transporter [Paenibacillus polymyxa]